MAQGEQKHPGPTHGTPGGAAPAGRADKAVGRRSAASRRTKGPGAAPPRSRPPVRTDRPARISAPWVPLRSGQRPRHAAGAAAPARPAPRVLRPSGGAALGPPRPRLGRPRWTTGRGRHRPKLSQKRLPPQQFRQPPLTGSVSAPPRSPWLPGGRSLPPAEGSGGSLPAVGGRSEPRVRLSRRAFQAFFPAQWRAKMEERRDLVAQRRGGHTHGGNAEQDVPVWW
ncbi:translation initiation factor IF-2-like [Serinus canaria]|uniref:translation initiation factor IF-2-like n=1 Tax=Serinus canaria TaxID=9135 RepID=UPI0021CC4F42|nr:translation initiation factor IF-2-like [Serinus canaria]